MPGKEKYAQKCKLSRHLGKTERERERQREFYLRLLHSSLCWRWEKEEEREMKRGREPDSCFKVEKQLRKHTRTGTDN